jgi:hypothetical protein
MRCWPRSGWPGARAFEATGKWSGLLGVRAAEGGGGEADQLKRAVCSDEKGREASSTDIDSDGAG